VKKEATVLILCGGKGERLRPLTHNIPKPLIRVNKKPILSYIFDHLTKYNLNDFVIATGYKSHKIEDYLQQMKPKFRYRIVDSGDVDIIQRIKDASVYIKNDFMVLYGDTISDIDISNLIKFHRSHNNLVTITVWPLKTQFGLVEISEDSHVISFQEKPVLGKWINIGYFYFNFEMMQMINQYDTFEELLIASSKQKLLSAYKHNNMHLTINNLSELNEADEELNKLIGI